MKRLLATLLLIFSLSFPVVGGHTLPGMRYCDCTPVEGTCPCCGTIFNGYTPQSVVTDETSESKQVLAPVDERIGLETLIQNFFMWLELRA